MIAFNDFILCILATRKVSAVEGELLGCIVPNPI